MIVYNGDSPIALEIAKFTGNILPNQIVSSGPDIFIKFVSDYITAVKGFSIQYGAGKKYVIVDL